MLVSKSRVMDFEIMTNQNAFNLLYISLFASYTSCFFCAANLLLFT